MNSFVCLSVCPSLLPKKTHGQSLWAMMTDSTTSSHALHQHHAQQPKRGSGLTDGGFVGGPDMVPYGSAPSSEPAYLPAGTLLVRKLYHRQLARICQTNTKSGPPLTQTGDSMRDRKPESKRGALGPKTGTPCETKMGSHSVTVFVF